MKRPISAVLVCLMFLVPMTATKRKSSGGSKGKPKFDYYLLALSWAPTFCASHPQDKSSECKTGNHATFVLHGLWPQADSGQPPMSCKPASPVSSSIARHMLEYMPSRSLIQHEWEKHGTCSGLSAADYFKNVENAFTAVKVPDEFKNLDHKQNFALKDVEQKFAQANNAPEEAFRISCHAGELISVEACLTKDLQYQACSKSARSSRRSSKVSSARPVSTCSSRSRRHATIRCSTSTTSSSRPTWPVSPRRPRTRRRSR